MVSRAAPGPCTRDGGACGQRRGHRQLVGGGGAPVLPPASLPTGSFCPLDRRATPLRSPRGKPGGHPRSTFSGRTVVAGDIGPTARHSPPPAAPATRGRAVQSTFVVAALRMGVPGRATTRELMHQPAYGCGSRTGRRLSHVFPGRALAAIANTIHRAVATAYLTALFVVVGLTVAAAAIDAFGEPTLRTVEFAPSPEPNPTQQERSAGL